MCSFSIRKSPTSSFIFPKIAPILVRHRFTPPLLVPSVKQTRFRVDASLSGTSWVSKPPKDKYGGWALSDDDNPSPHLRTSEKKWRNVVITGVGSSLAVLLATLAYFSISRKGFSFSNPLHQQHNVDSDQIENEESEITTSLFTEENNSEASEANSESVDNVSDTVSTTSTGKTHSVTTPVAVDAAQQEAVAVLKKLKIIEDDVVADDLCTRREYARWLVRSNSLLERNPKHRIVPAVALAGSSIAAFDDVNTEDPDFKYIQALAEAGITSSKLCGEVSSGNINFYPESFVSRLDLVNWKAQLECDFHPEIMEEISRTKVDYIDTKNLNPDMALGFFLDFLMGDKSTIRNVFGRIKRFQPNRPVTKAQAAVALTSGKMAKAVSEEVSRLEAESLSQKVEMEEIKSELLEKDEIRQSWDEKFQVERSRGVEMEELYLSSVSELEQEKIDQEKWFAERLKEKAAIDCQKQLVNSLSKEIDEMSQKLTSDRSVYLDEHSKLQEMLSELQSKLDSLVDKRCILEAEVEALRILRSWIEDEARASQARAKVLEEAGRRWKWSDHS